MIGYLDSLIHSSIEYKKNCFLTVAKISTLSITSTIPWKSYSYYLKCFINSSTESLLIFDLIYATYNN